MVAMKGMSGVLVVVAVAVTGTGTGCGRLGFDPNGVDEVAPDASDPITMISGLVAYWPFDDLAPGGTTDLVADQRATCTGGECPGRGQGASGPGAVFDGVNDCLLVPSLNTFAAPEFTLSAWVQVSAPTSGPLVVKENYSGCPSAEMALTNNSLGLVQINLSSSHNEVWSTTTMTPAWHHVVARWDGTAQQLYVDGRCCTATPAMTTLASSMAEFTLGCYPATGRMFGGGLDEVRTYDRALAATEIGALYTTISGEPPPVSTGCAEACALTPP